MADVSAVASEISSVEGLVSKAEEGASKLEGRDRSAIAQKIVYLYIGAVIACLIFTIGIFWFLVPCPPVLPTGQPGNGAAAACLAWKEPADYLLQVLTTAVLPITGSGLLLRHCKSRGTLTARFYCAISPTGPP